MNDARGNPIAGWLGGGRTTLALACLLVLALAWAMLPPARAEMVTQTGGFVAMTASGGNEDVLYVIDNRSEQLLVYKVVNQKSLELLQRTALPDLFASAKAAAGGGSGDAGGD